MDDDELGTLLEENLYRPSQPPPVAGVMARGRRRRSRVAAIRMAAPALAVALVMAGGGALLQNLSPPPSPEIGQGYTEQPRGPGNDGTEDDAEPERSEEASLDDLRDMPLVSSDGQLRSEIDAVNTFTPEYIFQPVESLAELTERSDAVVVAVSKERRQVEQSGFPTTYQTFEVVDPIVGDVPKHIEVVVNGGVEEAGGDVALVQADGDPQFAHDNEYLLFLVATPPEAGERWWTYGPGVGRYRLSEGIISGTYADDLQVMGPAATQGRDEDTSADALGLVGTSLDDVKDRI